MLIYIGMDDTDTLDTRGTGALARSVAASLSDDYRVLGVIRQQLLRDPRVPCTKNNSAKGLIVEGAGDLQAGDLAALAARVRVLMLSDFIPGSDPGLCVCAGGQAEVPAEVIEFGQRAQRELLTKDEAREIAARHGIYLAELGGDGMGIIGALAAVGLTAGGNAGRYIQVGTLRSLTGLQTVESLLAAGVDAFETPQGEPVTSGTMPVERLRPARRGGRAVGVVQREGDLLAPLKLD